MIYFSSDLHLNHNKDFCYARRSFSSVDEMNQEIVRLQNEIVGDEDDYYILGDVCLGPNEQAVPLLKQLKGKIHVIRGNHDTEQRVKLYQSLGWDVHDALYMKYHKKYFFLSHFPCMTTNSRDKIWQTTVNLSGHTHQQSIFSDYLPFCYNVGVDAHRCRPIEITEIISNINEQVNRLAEP